MSELKFEELYLVTSRNGLTKPKRVRGVGYKFINMGEIFAYGRIKNIPTERVPCTDKELKTSALEPGDLLFARQSLVLSGAGKCSIFICDQETTVFESHLIRVRLNTDLYNPLFYYYYFQSYEGKGNIYSIVEQGAGAAGIRGSDLARIKVPVFDLETQNKVSKVLSNLDDKIHLLRQQNATLEAMAQALFKSWFVDFDPVIDNALAAGRELPEALAVRVAKRRAVLESGEYPKLPEEVRGLFPGGFVFSDILEQFVPEEWNTKSISEIADVIKGKSYKSAELQPSTTALVTLKSFKRGGGYRLDGLKEYTGKYKPGQEVFSGDLIVAYTDVTQAADLIGKPAMVIRNSHHEHLVISLDVAVIRPSLEHYKAYLYGIMQTSAFQNHTLSYSTGTTVLHLGKTAVPEYKITIPPQELLEYFSKLQQPKFDKIEQNVIEIGKLERLRDVLLPELISGRLGV